MPFSRPGADRNPLAEHFRGLDSSGSTGVPGVFVHDGQTRCRLHALETAALPRPVGGAAAGRAVPGQRALRHGAAIGGTCRHRTIARRGAASAVAPFVTPFLGLPPLSDLVEQLNHYRPRAGAYPNGGESGPTSNPPAGCNCRSTNCGAAASAQSDRRAPHWPRAFGFRVREAYGASSSCQSPAVPPRLPDVKATGCCWRLRLRQAARSRRAYVSSTLLPHLANRAQRLIRYDIGDAITLRARSVPCGSTCRRSKCRSLRRLLSLPPGTAASSKLMRARSPRARG